MQGITKFKEFEQHKQERTGLFHVRAKHGNDLCDPKFHVVEGEKRKRRKKQARGKFQRRKKLSPRGDQIPGWKEQ